MVDPYRFPVPALWQGLMLIALAFWMFYCCYPERPRTPGELWFSLALSTLIATLVTVVISGR